MMMHLQNVNGSHTTLDTIEGALFDNRYRKALTRYCENDPDDAVDEALELGRDALGQPHGLLGLIRAHHTALASLIEDSSGSVDMQQRFQRAQKFLVQVSVSFEVAHYTWHEMAHR